MDAETLARRAAGIHAKIAADLPPLSHVECRRCRRRLDLCAGDAVRYLRSGWPACCGATMALVTAREAAARAVARRD